MAFPGDWSNYKEITIASALVPADGTYLFDVSLVDDADIVAGANADGSDIRITNDDGSVQHDFGLLARGHFANLTGSHTWFHGPYAVFYGTGDGATNNRTFIGTVTHNGEWAVVSYDHDTEAWEHFKLKDGSADDHNNPAVMVRSDGKILCVYSAHNSPEMYARVSSAAEDVSAFGSEATISPDGTLPGGSGYTYPTLLKFSSEGATVARIYLIYRVSSPSRQWRYSFSDDDGATWSAGAELWTVSSNVPYMQASSNGVDRLDFIASDGHGDGAGTNFCHWYYDGVWRSTDGTDIGSPGFTSASMNSSSDVYNGDQRWHSDIVSISASAPWILYYRYASSGADQDLYLARYSAGSWSSIKLLDEGGGVEPTNNTHYPGVARFDPEDHTVFYAAIEVSGVYEIQKYETSDGGDTWTKTEDITSGSTNDNFRPYPVRNRRASDDAILIWMGNGRYDDFTDYHVGLRCHPPANGHLAANAIVKAPLTAASDTTLRVYYGNSAAADGQNRANVASGYQQFAPLSIDPRTGSVETLTDWSANAHDGTFNGNFLSEYSGEIFGADFHQFGSNDHVKLGSQINAAGQGEVALLAYVNWNEASGSGAEHTIFGAWDGATKGNILWRIEPSNDTLELFVGVATDTQIGGNITGVTLTPATWQLVYSHYDNDAASDEDMVARVDTSEAVLTQTNGNALDADPTVAAAIGQLTEASTSDSYFGGVGLFAVKFGTLSKDYTDVLSNSLSDQATFVSYGAEQTVGGGGAVSVTLETGAGTGTGHPPSVAIGEQVSVTLGSGSAQGQGHAPTIAKGVSVTTGTGSGSGIGHAPSVTVGEAVSVTLGTGTGQGTGQTPTVAIGKAVSLPAGSGTGTGHAPNVTAGESVSLTLGAGSGQGAGQEPSVAIGRSLAVPSGLGSGTGHKPSVSVGGAVSVSLGVGSASAVGQTPVITVGHSIPLPVGSGSGEGHALTVTTTTTPTTGNFTILELGGGGIFIGTIS